MFPTKTIARYLTNKSSPQYSVEFVQYIIIMILYKN